MRLRKKERERLSEKKHWHCKTNELFGEKAGFVCCRAKMQRYIYSWNSSIGLGLSVTILLQIDNNSVKTKICIVYKGMSRIMSLYCGVMAFLILCCHSVSFALQEWHKFGYPARPPPSLFLMDVSPAWATTNFGNYSTANTRQLALRRK